MSKRYDAIVVGGGHNGLTAAAYLQADRSRVDVMVMEVGLGGRLDASNTWDPDVAAITHVGLDQQKFLGETVESVAALQPDDLQTMRPRVHDLPGSTMAGSGRRGIPNLSLHRIPSLWQMRLWPGQRPRASPRDVCAAGDQTGVPREP